MENLGVSQKKVFGTIAFRVFLASFIFIIVPLFFFYLSEYKREYRERKKDFFNTLRVLGESKANRIEDHMKKRIYYFLRLAPTQSLQEIKQTFGFQEASILIKKDDQLICIDSSNKNNIGKNYNAFLPAFAHHQYRIVYGGLIYLTQVLSDNRLLIGSNSLDEFIQKIHLVYPIEMSLASHDKIFASTKSSFVGKQVHLQPVKGMEQGYIFNESNIAVVEPLEDLSVTLILDVAQKHLKGIHFDRYLWRIGKMLLFVGLIGGGGALLLISKMSAPLKELLKVMKKIKEGDLSVRYTHQKMGYEINLLGQSFNDMIQALVKHQKIAEQERVEKEKLAEELTIGHNIQMSLFPTTMPHIKRVDITPGYIPAKEVGGDFYDIYQHNDRLYLLIADVCGKGISACLYSLGVRSLFRSYFVLGKPISEVVAHVNEVFYQDVEDSSIFVTAWIGELDLKTRTLQYCSLGHFPTLLAKTSGEILELQTDGIALGVAQKIEVFEKTIPIEQEDLLVLYTDGVIEAHDHSMNLYGIDKLKDFVTHQKQLPTKEVVTALLQDVKVFAADEEQADDITIVAMRLL